jgi:hypothetical protein
MYNQYFSMKYTDKINNEAIVFQVWFGNAYLSSYSQKILKTDHKNSVILTRPTPVLRKINKMGAPRLSF